MQVDDAATLRFKAVAEADPGALVRVLQFLQARHIVTRRVVAQRTGSAFLEIEVEIDAADLAPEMLDRVVAKIGELPVIVTALVCEGGCAD